MLVSLPLSLTHLSSSGRHCLRGIPLRAYWIDFSLCPSLWRLNKIFKPTTEGHRTMKANRNWVAKFLGREEKEALHSTQLSFCPPPSGRSTCTQQWCKEWRWDRKWQLGTGTLSLDWKKFRFGVSKEDEQIEVEVWGPAWLKGPDTVETPPGWLYYERRTSLRKPRIHS